MPDTSADLIRAARKQAASRSAELQGLPDHARLAELFRRQTVLDGTGLGPELAKFRNALGLVAPQPPTVRGKFSSLVGMILGPVLWRLLRALGSPNPFEAVYEMVLCQLDWQVAAENRIADELAAIRARLDALEAFCDGRRELG